MKVLLHICCSICAIYPAKLLKEEGYVVKGIFYNPNIHPFEEYFRRKKSLNACTGNPKIEIEILDYTPFEFFRKISFNESSPERCEICWRLRLEKTKEIAIREGFDAFTTTLLSSPYQAVEKIGNIGENLSIDKNLKFLIRNFRQGFTESHRIAKEWGLYQQKYCGCIYSEIEKYSLKNAKN